MNIRLALSHATEDLKAASLWVDAREAALRGLVADWRRRADDLDRDPEREGEMRAFALRVAANDLEAVLRKYPV